MSRQLRDQASSDGHALLQLRLELAGTRIYGGPKHMSEEWHAKGREAPFLFDNIGSRPTILSPLTMETSSKFPPDTAFSHQCS